MSQSRIHWGILGISAPNAQTIAQAIDVSHTGVLVAVAGSPEGTQKFAQTFVGMKTSAKDISVYYDYEDLIADRNVNAIYITLPTVHHCQWISKAILSKKHVLCSAPFEISSEKMLSIINTVQAAKNIYCMEAMLYHSHPFFEELKKIIVTDKTLGDIRFYNAIHTMDLSYIESHPKGGSIINLGYNPLSLIRHLIDAEPTSMYGTGTLDPTTKEDKEATLILRFANGIKATIQTADNISLSWQFHVIGTKGTLTITSNPWLPSNQSTVQIKLFDPNQPNASISSEETTHLHERPPYSLHSYGIDVLGKCIQNKALSNNALTLDHTLGNIKIINEWRRRVKENQHQPEKKHHPLTLANISYFKRNTTDEKRAQPDAKPMHWNNRS
jgi:predicted dehydrogenase